MEKIIIVEEYVPKFTNMGTSIERPYVVDDDNENDNIFQNQGNVINNITQNYQMNENAEENKSGNSTEETDWEDLIDALERKGYL